MIIILGYAIFVQETSKIPHITVLHVILIYVVFALTTLKQIVLIIYMNLENQ